MNPKIWVRNINGSESTILAWWCVNTNFTVRGSLGFPKTMSMSWYFLTIKGDIVSYNDGQYLVFNEHDWTILE